MKEIDLGNGKVLKDNGEHRTFATGGKREMPFGKGRFDLVPLTPLAILAKVFEAGALKYGDRNWEQGLPLSRFFDPMLRHLLKWWLGLTDEDHRGMVLWNLWCLIHTDMMIEVGALPAELRDMPVLPKELGQMLLEMLTPAPSSTPSSSSGRPETPSAKPL